MARIRSIKPEFPHSESMGRISRDARLAFIMLWTVADDSGRLRGNSRMLASLLFPYDDDAKDLMPVWLDELDRQECITRYMVGTDNYIEICNWLNHQKIDKPSASKIPAPDDASRILANVREASTTDQGSKDLRIKDQGEEGSGVTTVSSVDATSVFSHWQQVMQKPRAIFDDKRKRLIRTHLKAGYTTQDLIDAITGCSMSPFHMGLNEKGQRYDSLELILRDAGKIDQFTGYKNAPPAPMSRQDMVRAGNEKAFDDWIAKQTTDAIDGECSHA